MTSSVIIWTQSVLREYTLWSQFYLDPCLYLKRSFQYIRGGLVWALLALALEHFSWTVSFRHIKLDSVGDLVEKFSTNKVVC